jgi:hypothetical protein
MNNSNSKWIIVATIVIAIGIGFFFFSKNDKNSKKSKNDDQMSQTSDPTKNNSYSDGTRVSEDGESGVDGVGASPEFLIEQYLEWAQYPPNSRPISNFHYDIVQPFFVQESPIVMADTPTTKEANGFKCHLQPKTWAAIGINAEMLITLECRNKDNQTIPIKINDSKVFREFEGQKFSSVRADYNDDGRDGDEVAKDNITTFKWRSMKNDWGQMSLEADIEYGDNKKATLTSTFFSSPSKPAEATNVYRETIQDGSLVVYSTINVYKAGNYHFEANLKEEQSGNYIAYATFDGPLKSGAQEVEFLFFGKVLRDKGYDGPYLISDIRGHRVNLAIDPAWLDQGEEGLKKIQAAKTTEPDKELVLPLKEELKTNKYNVSQFSNKSFNSSEKEARLNELKELAKK